MERTPEQNTSPARFALAVAAVCVMVFAVIARLATPGSTDAAGQPLSPVELDALARQATLRLAVSSCGSVTRGSGVIIDGRLVTNAHVVEGATEVKADQPIDAVLLPVTSIDIASDLATAAPPAGVSLILASPADTGADRVAGQAVVLAGHADGGAIELQSGTVSARVAGGAYGYGVDVLLIDAPTRGGYSGGPVLDDAGNVLAILSGFDQATGLSVAIPADVVADVLTLEPAPAVLASDCGVG